MVQERGGEQQAAAEEALRRAAELACEWIRSLPERHVGARAGAEDLRRALGGALPARGEAPVAVVERLAAAVEGGLVASAGPRFFGYVIGGSLPAALAADWLAAAWDQNAGLYSATPAGSVVEEVAGTWVLDLLGLPAAASVGFVTGGQMANWTGLAAGRHAVLRDAGWDVEADGLQGAPPIIVLVGEQGHATVDVALRYLGLGTRSARRIESDAEGRMRPDALRRALDAVAGPCLVSAQAGNVNTGAFDPLREIAEACRARGAWLHVDGAFGLWAAASPSTRHLVDGLELASSWATDAHKWLNVPYDSGIVVVADPAAHAGATAVRASYLIHAEGAARDPLDWTPEFSRRARGFAVWAALRALGREGVGELVERGCALARRMAERLAASGFAVLNEVVLNQVLFRVEAADAAAADELTRRLVPAVQEEGTCWLSGTSWQGRPAVRVSISGWSTAEQDIDRSAAAIQRSLARLR